MGLVLAAASLAAVDTNQPPPRPAVAVLCWLPEELAALAAQDWHWLRTFDRLVSDELRHVGALRVIAGQAVEREAARHKLRELKPDEAARTNAVLSLRRMGENLRASWLVVGALARTGATWTAHARLMDARSGQSRQRFTAASTNWFELRD